MGEPEWYDAEWRSGVDVAGSIRANGGTSDLSVRVMSRLLPPVNDPLFGDRCSARPVQRDHNRRGSVVVAGGLTGHASRPVIADTRWRAVVHRVPSRCVDAGTPTISSRVLTDFGVFPVVHHPNRGLSNIEVEPDAGTVHERRRIIWPSSKRPAEPGNIHRSNRGVDDRGAPTLVPRLRRIRRTFRRRGSW